MGTITKRALAAAMASSESKVSTSSASKVAEGASKVVDSASAVAKDSDADGLCEFGSKYVCNNDFFRARIMRYPAFVWIYGCSQIPEGSPFAHEDSPFFEGKDERWCVQPYLSVFILVLGKL